MLFRSFSQCQAIYYLCLGPRRQKKSTTTSSSRNILEVDYLFSEPPGNPTTLSKSSEPAIYHQQEPPLLVFSSCILRILTSLSLFLSMSQAEPLEHGNLLHPHWQARLRSVSVVSFHSVCYSLTFPAAFYFTFWFRSDITDDVMLSI